MAGVTGKQQQPVRRITPIGGGSGEAHSATPQPNKQEAWRSAGPTGNVKLANIVTIDDLKLRILESELLQIAGVGSHNQEDGRSLDLDRISEAISFADDMITGHLRRRYPLIDTLAVEDQPEMLKGFASDIVRYRLRSRTGNQNQVSDEVRHRYDQAMSYLGKASRGLVDVLFVDENDTPDEAGGAKSQVLVSHADEISTGLMRGYDG